jgi:hypothetical protein
MRRPSSLTLLAPLSKGAHSFEGSTPFRRERIICACSLRRPTERAVGFVSALQVCRPRAQANDATSIFTEAACSERGLAPRGAEDHATRWIPRPPGLWVSRFHRTEVQSRFHHPTAPARESSLSRRRSISRRCSQRGVGKSLERCLQPRPRMLSFFSCISSLSWLMGPISDSGSSALLMMGLPI